ncbi:MAG: hypothetical protein WBW06_22400 [Xanthobacteraceae bacterium]
MPVDSSGTDEMPASSALVRPTKASAAAKVGSPAAMVAAAVAPAVAKVVKSSRRCMTLLVGLVGLDACAGGEAERDARRDVWR